MAALLALAVGIVLADSAIVTLALPDVLRDFDAQVGDVVWVLTAYNLVLGLAAVPAARASLAAAGARRAAVAGVLLFAGASAACALAGTLEVLIGARVVQALGGALLITAALELLVGATGDERRGAARWATAGVIGAGVGPVAGGLLTELITWRSIFWVQVPLVLAAWPAALRAGAAAARDGAATSPAGGLHHETHVYPAHDGVDHGPVTGAAAPGAAAKHDRPRIAANLALGLLSAALAAALFLLVLLLVEGWRRTPIAAALTVTVIPLAALAAGRLARRAGAGPRGETAAGAILMAGGLAALALLPDASIAWTIAPQVLVGLGLGLTVEALTAYALADRFPRAVHGGWTIAARHLGIVAGLLLLAPLFTSDLDAARAPAQDAATRLLIDAPVSGETKLALADALQARLREEDGRVPDLAPAFATTPVPAADRGAVAELQTAMDDAIERAATHAFQRAFLAGALLAGLALLPALALGRTP